MGDISYAPLVKDFVWSYSNLQCFNSCKYRWFLKYIKKYKDEDRFYASYGSFMHELIEKYYTGELRKEELQTEFLLRYSEKVRGVRPSAKIAESYLQAGKEYFKNFTPFKYKPLAIEERIQFKINDVDFVAKIDFIGEDDDGELVIIDNKSRNIKPRSKRKTQTLKDEELDNMLKQLYIYSAAVKSKYGKYPKTLGFNCFKINTIIEEPFVMSAFEETMSWVSSVIKDIEETDDFNPSLDYFVCNNICGISELCDYKTLMYNTKRKT